MSFAVGFFYPLLFLACPAQQTTSTPTPVVSSTPAAQTKTVNARIDGERAMNQLREQLKFGPRPAGSSALNQTRDYIVKELNSYGLKITKDQFRVKTPVGEKTMVNITAEVPGESSDFILLASHYDTKLFKEFRFVGANDGASSTAVLLEIARVLALQTNGPTKKPGLSYRLVFFDGEEAFCRDWSECGTEEAPDHTYGSRHYVEQLKNQGELKSLRAMILLDMIGAKDLQLGKDELGTSWLIETIWQTARELGYSKQFVDRTEAVDDDDHKPFLEAGVEAVDLIQLSSYSYWHTAADTVDKISPQSLQIIGDVVLASLPRIEEKLIQKKPK